MSDMVNFQRELERYKHELGNTQYWRYKGGRVPQWFIWLVQRPELAQALADDAWALKSRRISTGVQQNVTAD